MEHIKEFQELLRKLFQFDCADLDFGIYRIMNYKRDVIEKFIQEKLPKAISYELEQGTLAGQSQAAEELEAARKKVLEALGDDALDASGVLNEQYHATKAGKAYLSALEKTKSAKGREALEAAIYNHLYAFFNRYYQDGDFISKRRYSKRERYAIPYNGEEVMLYWANSDQYYIKTGEYFTDYTWKAANGVTVNFKLTAADIEQNNVKGEKRFFLPQLNEIAWDESAQSLTIPFAFRPLDGREAIAYGGKNQQEAIIVKVVESISKQRLVKTAPLALAALDAEKRRSKDDECVTNLEHHMRNYTRRNTSDFFIHKDLKGFLSRELDFYLKNEVLNLEEMEAAGEGLSEGWFQMLRLIKKVGGNIIEFLEQIEAFQKMLWEKRKFVTETFYCITMSNVPEACYQEIAACDAQWEEWKTLLRIDEDASLFPVGKGKKDRRTAFLKSHPTLVLDTRYFSADFTDGLLASFDDIDEATDGLLANSENWQALNLMTETYTDRVKYIHIDPPYNTDSSGFVYKNDFRHGSWLSMMSDRLRMAQRIMLPEGIFMCHIDENEYERLRLLFENMFGYVATAIWDKLNPMMGARELAIQHEYILICADESRSFIVKPENVKAILAVAAGIIQRHNGITEKAKNEFNELVKSMNGLTGGERAYQFLDDNGHVYRLVAMTWPNPNPPPAEFFKPLIHPITGKPCPVPNRGWSQSPKKMADLIKKGEIVFGEDESTQPQKKVELIEEKALSSVIRNGSRGKTDIEKLGLDFTYNHPVTLYSTLFVAGIGNGGIILDFFAGSGTSAHAIINLNREDGGRRKFILVEMAKYFDTVLLPRIKKVTFSPEWKDGRPKRMATAEEAERSPRIVKVIRLESYEDALNNIVFDDPSGQQAMRFEDYLLQYMLKWETRKSETLLNVEKLAKPFSYQLHIHRDLSAGQAGGETRAHAVDLPETFNYLLGLNVRKRFAIKDGDRHYLVYQGDTREGRKVAVMWRETEGWKEKDYTRDKVFVAAQKLTESADDIYVNGDSYIPGARALEPLFKARMFADVEA